MLPSFTTRCLCRMAGPRDAISQAAARKLSGTPSNASSRCLTTHACSPDMTTCRGGREPQWESTVARQKAENIHLRKANSEGEFISLRESRDRTLPMPKLILLALQVNIAGGRLPEPESNGRRYLKIPMDALKHAIWDE